MNTLKVESGIQLLTRLHKKSNLENFYTVLFEDSLKYGEVTEIYSHHSKSLQWLILDLMCEALIPAVYGGADLSVLIINTDGNFDFDLLFTILRYKIFKNSSISKEDIDNKENFNEILKKILRNLYVLEIYDLTQFYVSIQSLERILMEQPTISLVIFNTLNAFYWSEQVYKISKMCTYLKKLLRIIQKVTKEFKISLIYTRPENFYTTKNSIKNLEPCCEQPTPEKLNYRIQIVSNEDQSFQVNIRTYNKLRQRFFTYENDIKWQNVISYSLF